MVENEHKSRGSVSEFCVRSWVQILTLTHLPCLLRFFFLSVCVNNILWCFGVNSQSCLETWDNCTLIYGWICFSAFRAAALLQEDTRGTSATTKKPPSNTSATSTQTTPSCSASCARPASAASAVRYLPWGTGKCYLQLLDHFKSKIFHCWSWLLCADWNMQGTRWKDRQWSLFIPGVVEFFKLDLWWPQGCLPLTLRG